jgi:hypothetical protein
MLKNEANLRLIHRCGQLALFEQPVDNVNITGQVYSYG